VFWFPIEGIRFFSSENIQSLFKAQPVSYSMDTGRFLTCGKAAGTWSWPFIPSSLENKKEWSYTYTTSVFVVCTATNLHFFRKSSLNWMCTAPWMRMEVGGKDPLFLNPDTKCGECSAPRPDRYKPLQEAVCTHLIWDWLRLALGLGVLQERKISSSVKK